MADSTRPDSTEATAAAATAGGANTAGAHDHDAELKLYFKVYGSLLALTVVTVIFGLLTGLPPWLGLVIAMVIAATKGTLVVLYFMHLKMESKNIYLIAGIPLMLGIILLVALMPDISQ